MIQLDLNPVFFKSTCSPSNKQTNNPKANKAHPAKLTQLFTIGI